MTRPEMTHLYIRTEASPAIGLGHVMRCFAIAEEARRRDMPVTFLLNDRAAAVADRLKSIKAKITPMTSPIGTAEDAAALVARLPSKALLIIDSYAIDSAYLGKLQGYFEVILMDDLAALPALPCRFLINASAGAADLPYTIRAPGATKLLGPRYAQIRREFVDAPTPVLREPSLAVMFGGSDPRGYSLEAARRLLEGFPTLTIKVIAGPALQNLERLQELAEREPRLELYANPPRVADILAGSSLAVTAAGGSVGEIAAMGLMALVVVVAANQQLAFSSSPYPVLDGRDGFPTTLIERAAYHLTDEAASNDVAKRAKSLIDGAGCSRIIEALTTPLIAPSSPH